jgi:hypothetical protein
LSVGREAWWMDRWNGYFASKREGGGRRVVESETSGWQDQMQIGQGHRHAISPALFSFNVELCGMLDSDGLRPGVHTADQGTHGSTESERQ